MPLFGRRQSEGNVLDLMEKSRSSDALSSGFTVLTQEEVAARKARREALEAEKEKSSRKSFAFSFGNKKSRMSSFEDDSGSSNRGSNTSSIANSTSSNLYSTGSSARLSSGTLPSSNGGETADDLYIQRSSTSLPAVPRPLAHRDRAATMSPAETFQRNHSSPNIATMPDHPPPPPPKNTEHNPRWSESRSRATTASSYASTARPPKLDLGVSNFGDFGGELFGSSDDSHDAMRSQSHVRPSDQVPPLPPPHSHTPQPLPSPYSPRDSDAGAPLLPTSQERSPGTPTFPIHVQKKQAPGRTQVTQATPHTESDPIARTRDQAADFSVTQTAVRLPAVPPHSSASAPRPYSQKSAGSGSNLRMPSYSVDLTEKPAIPAPFRQDELDDEPIFPASSKPAFQTPPPQVKIQDESPSRTVTTAEFERMKVMAGLNPEQANNGDEYASDSDGEESDSERKRRDRFAREKQQGDLAVNRQIYRKTVGGPPEMFSNRFSSQGSAVVTPLRETETDRKQFEQDGDWDVPLGALAAHGFPKTTPARPSTGGIRQVSTSSMADIRGSAQFATNPSVPDRPMSTVGSVSGQMTRPVSSLPPFARGLPQDPHLGGVVPNHPREQLRFNRTSSVPLMPPGQPQPTNSTLMDVIMGEEKARATRRGSPSSTGLQGPQFLAQQNQQHPQRISMMPPPQPQMSMMPNQYMGMQQPSPDVQLLQQQLQFQQQMMAQMQQQLMMMQMTSSGASIANGRAQSVMGMPIFEEGFMSNQGLQLPPIQHRPMSMATNMQAMNGAGYANRPMSTYTPSMYGMGRPNGYAPSIAPSERNTTGMSSRYRSVGNLQGDNYSVAGAQASRPVSRGGAVQATLRAAGSRGKLRSPTSDDSDEEKYFAEANARAKARRAQTEPNLHDRPGSMAVA